jgi:hypothetical protein
MKRFFSLLVLLVFISGFSPDNNWISLSFKGNSCSSSELNPGNPFEGERGAYGAFNLFDNDPATAWVEGVKGYGNGEYFFANLGYSLPEKIEIRNGYQKSESIFKKNSRVKSAKITLFAGFHIPGDVTEIAELYTAKPIGNGSVVKLYDAMGLQEIPLPVDMEVAFRERVNLTKDFKTEFRERLEMVSEFETPMELHYFLKFEIMEVYPGSSWDDTCISDILFSVMIPDPVSADEIIRKVYEPGEGGQVIFDTDIRSGIVLVDIKELREYKETEQGVSMAITIMDTSPDKEWVQVDFMFSAAGARVEENPVLYHVRSGRRIGTDIFDYSGGMYGFTEKDGKIWLETDKGPVDLEMIKKKLTVN